MLKTNKAYKKYLHIQFNIYVDQYHHRYFSAQIQPIYILSTK